MNTEILILIGGALHFVVLIASIQAPRLLRWTENLSKLPEYLHVLFWVYGGFIFLTIAGFGTLSLLFFEELAAGSPLARGVAGFIGLFWLARLGIQFWVFDVRAMLLTRLHRVGYHGLTVLFILLVLIYGWIAFQPMTIV